jgi:hypothetical protein
VSLKPTCVTLTPKTQKGKNAIHNTRQGCKGWDGTTWWVTQWKDRVLFSDKPGPWLMIEPAINVGSMAWSRWVHKDTDDNVTVTFLP